MTRSNGLSSPIIYPTSSSLSSSLALDPLATPSQPPSTAGNTPPISTHSRSRRHDLGTSALLSDAPDERVRVIWGTTVVVQETMENFRHFLAHPPYPLLLQHLHDTESDTLNLDTSHLRSHPRTLLLSRHLISHPQEIIPLLDATTAQVYSELFPASPLPSIRVRPFNLETSTNLRSLSPSDVDQLVSIKGLIIRTSPILPDMRVAYFQCSICEAGHHVESFRGKVQEPPACPRCHAKHGMILIHNRCQYSDKQLIRVQETPDTVPDGQTPHAVTICVYESLVDSTRPGDRVEITGLFRVSNIRLNNRQRRIQNIFRTYIDAVHIRRCGDDNVTNDNDTAVTNAKEGDNEIIEIAKHPDLYHLLSRSIAPSVFQLDTVKKSLLLQLFGGVSKSTTRYGASRLRGDIHVLITGDPSVSKSQLLSHVHKLAPRGVYASGKGSSAVGLTAYITRDPESGQLVLESGALVLSDGGLCCIDEFDKMPDTTRAILHEVMEQQTISVAKAGIITTLNARTSVLAAANPVDSRYNPSKSIIENIHLPPSLLSRFDIICLVLDRPDEAHDIQLARHIASLHMVGGGERSNDFLAVDVLSKYISYARKNVRPVLSDEAMRGLLEGYVAMRRVNQPGDKTVSATTRQLESLIRLAEAHARMRLSGVVEMGDVAEAIRLVKSAILSYALDPVTGKVDMDLVTIGKSASFREQAEELGRRVKEHLQGRGALPVEMGALMKEMEERSSVPISERLFREALVDLVEGDVVHIAGGPGTWKAGTMIRRL